jgi:hypothetical protein
VPTFLRFFVFFGAGLLLAGPTQAVYPLASPCAEGDNDQKPFRAKPVDGLPAGAIARLGTPVVQIYNQFAIYVMFLSDGRTAVTGGPNKKVAFWDARTGKAIRSVDGARFIEVSSDGKMLASKTGWGDTIVRLVDLATEKEIGKFVGGAGGGNFCFSADGRYLAIGGGQANGRTDDYPLRVWDIATRKVLRTFPVRDALECLAFSPDGKRLVTARLQHPPLQVWDVAIGTEIRNFDTDSGVGTFHALCVSPDGALLVAVSRVPRAWDLSTGKKRWQIFSLHDRGDVTLDVTFSPNGQMVALGTSKGNVFLLEAATGRERACFATGITSIASVAFSRCGLMLASAGSDCAPLVWDVTGLVKSSSGRPQPLAAKELDAHWDDLRRDDAVKAWKAILALVARPEQAVPLLKDRLADRKGMLAPKRLARLLADLDSDAFATREEAGSVLKNLGPVVSPALEKLCAGTASIEARRRAEGVLGQIAKSGLVSEPVLQGRVLEVLEYSASPAARELLQAEARGAPASPFARNAKAALDRIARRPAP